MLKTPKLKAGSELYVLLDKLLVPHFRKHKRVLGEVGEEQAVIMDGASAKLQVLLHSSQES